jgi:hypothetical protein
LWTHNKRQARLPAAAPSYLFLHWSFIIAAHCIKLAITQFLTQFVEFGL